MNKVVIAGAGTGKTYALVEQYLLKVATIHPAQVLAVTFTDKAAAEMRARVMSKLRLQSSVIGTFHSFCAQLLREHASAVGIDPAFNLLDPIDDHRLALEIAESIVLEALAENCPGVDELVARFQLRRFGDAMGLADHLVSLYQSMTEHGLSAAQIVVPSANDNLQELVQDLGRAISEFQQSPKLSAKTQERLEAIEQAFKSLMSIIDDVDDREVKLSSMYKRLREQMIGRFGSDEHRSRLVMATTKLGSYFCQSFTSPQAHVVRELLDRFSNRLLAHKIRFDSLGFSDLLVLTRQLLRDNLAVRQRVKERYKYILVDEFQDTSPLQEDIVALICEARDTLQKFDANERVMTTVRLEPDVLFVVGDPKQSIYGFRGSDVSLFNEVIQRVDHRENLTLCRRSQAAVVELVNLVASATMPFSDDDRLQAMKESLGPAGYIWEVRSAEEIATHIKQLVDDGGVLPGEIAVLVRRVKAAGPIVQALLQIGVPARVFGGEGFFEQLEITDLISALKLAIDRTDSLAALAVLRSPLVGMSDNDFVCLLNLIPDWTQGVDWNRLVSVSEHPQLRRCHDILDRINVELGEISVAQAIDHLLENMNDIGADQLANMTKLRAMTMTDRVNARERIQELWEMLDNPPRESLAEPFEMDSNAVRVMTIHQSKGLEFNRVVLADMNSRLQNETDEIAFDHEAGLALTHRGRPIAACAPQKTEDRKYAPTSIDVVRQRRRARVEEEFSRLLYVAMTRAKEYLYVVDVRADEEKSSDRGLSLNQLLWQARRGNEALFDQLLPRVRSE